MSSCPIWIVCREVFARRGAAVADALRGQQPPPVVGDAVEKALARTVRHAGGLQWLIGLAEAVAACHEQGSLGPLEAFTANLEPARATGVGSAFVDAAWSLAATADDSSENSGSDPRHARHDRPRTHGRQVVRRAVGAGLGPGRVLVSCRSRRPMSRSALAKSRSTISPARSPAEAVAETSVPRGPAYHGPGRKDSSMNPSVDGTWRRWVFNADHGQLRTAQGVTVDELRVAEHSVRRLPGPVMDLIELVAAIHLVDRAEPRPRATKPGDSWSRRLHLIIGVRESQSVGPIRRFTINLSGSCAHLPMTTGSSTSFLALHLKRPAECVQFLFQSAPGGDVVALFSGGLDSLAGTGGRCRRRRDSPCALSRIKQPGR